MVVRTGRGWIGRPAYKEGKVCRMNGPGGWSPEPFRSSFRVYV